jgi:F0F1-type ATP synthase membrane subunit b/b'
MALWDRVRTELDRAGRVAQQAFDEGRLRLEMLRARRHADTAAQRLGYATYRAKRESRELATDEYTALARSIEQAEAEVERYRRLIDEATARRRQSLSQPTDPGHGSS